MTLRYLLLVLPIAVHAAAAGACEPALRTRPETVAGYVEMARACLSAPPAGATFDHELEAGFLEAINAARAEAGLPSLAWRAQLLPAARFHALDMGLNDFFAHTGPDGRAPEDRMAALDRRALTDFAGENVAYLEVSRGQIRDRDALERLHGNLMDSPGHRANILNAKATHVAVGVVRIKGGIWVAQAFMGLRGTLPEDAPLRLSARSRLRAPLGLDGWTFVRFDAVRDGVAEPIVSASLAPGDAMLGAYAEQPGERPGSRYTIRFMGPAVSVER